MRRLGVGWARAIRVSQERADRNEYGADRVDGRPVVLDQVHAEGAIGVDVRVELQAERGADGAATVAAPEGEGR